MRDARPPRRDGQTWAAFLCNHAPAIWACDFLPVTDLRFRPLHAFFVIAHGSRRVVPVGVTRHPTDAWVAQQLREATPFGERPRYLARDRDSKYGPAFARVAAATGSTELRTAYRAPRQNACAGRLLHPELNPGTHAFRANLARASFTHICTHPWQTLSCRRWSSAG